MLLSDSEADGTSNESPMLIINQDNLFNAVLEHSLPLPSLVAGSNRIPRGKNAAYIRQRADHETG